MTQPIPDIERELPELAAVRTYVRCLDRLFESLPATIQWDLFQPMISAAVSMGSGIACFHSERLDARRVTVEDREAHRRRSLRGVRASRRILDRIAGEPDANRAELLVARALLDRIESSVMRATVPGER